MKKRAMLLIGLLGCLMFTTIQGCGQPAEEETVSVVEETVSERNDCRSRRDRHFRGSGRIIRGSDCTRRNRNYE